MTHANVGSLLVYDPAKVNIHERNASAHAQDSVVGIITERGAQITPPNKSPLYTPTLQYLIKFLK